MRDAANDQALAAAFARSGKVTLAAQTRIGDGNGKQDGGSQQPGFHFDTPSWFELDERLARQPGMLPDCVNAAQPGLIRMCRRRSGPAGEFARLGEQPGYNQRAGGQRHAGRGEHGGDAAHAQVKLSFSGFLNALDGVATQEGNVLFMTTNHPELLDPALIRAGRIDEKVELNLCTPDQLQRLYLKFNHIIIQNQISKDDVSCI